MFSRRVSHHWTTICVPSFASFSGSLQYKTGIFFANTGSAYQFFCARLDHFRARSFASWLQTDSDSRFLDLCNTEPLNFFFPRALSCTLICIVCRISAIQNGYFSPATTGSAYTTVFPCTDANVRVQKWSNRSQLQTCVHSAPADR